MSTWFVVVRVLHIAVAVVAFVAAPCALAVVKGGAWHRRFGTVFVASMAIVAISGFPLAVSRSNWFIALISVFAGYLVFAGYRAARLKSNDARALDWTFAIIAALGGIGLIARGISMQRLGPVAIVFGAILLLSATSDMTRFRRPPKDARERIRVHLRSMLAAYITTITAFSVVNLHVLPPLARWLWPTVVGVPIITWWARRYRSNDAPPNSRTIADG
jgi:uncharacterized membrane protein